MAKRYGIEVQERELTEEDIRRNDNRESMFALNGWAYDYFADYLRKSSEGQSVGMSYFRQKRGFTEATIQKFGLGYCSAKGDAMTSAALARPDTRRSFSSRPDCRSDVNATGSCSTASTIG